MATARSGQEDEFVRSIGAADTVDWSGDVVAQVRAIAPDGVDAVLHLVGDPASLAGLLADGGTLAPPWRSRSPRPAALGTYRHRATAALTCPGPPARRLADRESVPVVPTRDVGGTPGGLISGG